MQCASRCRPPSTTRAVKSETLDAVLRARFAVRHAGAVPSELEMGILRRDLDPRTIRPEHMDLRAGEAGSARRVVRILNVNTNHYMCHLPV